MRIRSQLYAAEGLEGHRVVGVSDSAPHDVGSHSLLGFLIQWFIHSLILLLLQ